MRKTIHLVLLAATVASFIISAATTASPTKSPQLRWVGSWASSQQLVEPKNQLSGDDVTDATIRQLIRLSAGGKRLRVVFSNAFGSMPLKIDAAQVAESDTTTSSRIKVDTSRSISFAGSAEVLIPAGAEFVSDPIDMAVPALASLTISFHVPDTIQQQTGHPGSRSTSYVSKGNHVGDIELMDARKIDHWYQVAAVHVETDVTARAVVTLGDSITDGRGATTNANNRWPDLLAERLQASPKTKTVSVLNHGIGGNRLLQDGLGPNALSRFDHDVIAQPGVKWVIILEGINDLGTLTRDFSVSTDKHTTLVKQMIAVYEQMIGRAHDHGIKVIGCTILPDGASAYYHPDSMNEADRQAVNSWIRTSGRFDYVVDFDKALRDPDHAERLLPGYDSGDGLHPSPAGFKVMAEAIPLALFE